MKNHYLTFCLTGTYLAISRFAAFATFVFLFCASPLVAADYYWVGGSGNWSEHASHWATTSGGAAFHNQVPTSMDDVHFDANSFPAGGTVTVDQTIVYCRNMDWTGVTNTPVFAGTSSKTLHIYGSLTFASGMLLTFSGQIRFLSTLTGNTVTTAGKVFNNAVYFEGIGGEWIFQDNFTSNDRITQSAGILRTSGHAVSISGFSSGGDALYLGSSDVSITQTNFSIGASTLLDAGTSHILINAGNLSGGAFHTFYNVTLAGFGTVSFVSVSQKLTFQGNNSSYEGTTASVVNEVEFQQKGNIEGNNAYFNIATFLGDGDIDGNNTFLTLNLAPGFFYRFQQGKTTTIAAGGAFNASGPGCNNYITLISQSAGNQAFINTSGANFALQYITLMDMAVTGGGTITAASSIDLGNNTGWNISPPSSRTLYWVGGGGNWDEVTHWSLTSGGAGGVCIPSAFDDVVFDQNSGFGAVQSVSVNDDIAYCRNMSWTNVANMPEFKVASSSNKLYVYGSLAFTTGMALNFNGSIHFRATSTGKTVYTAGKTFIKTVYFEGAGGEWIFQDNFTSSDRITHLAGTLRTGGNAVSVSGFSSSGAALYLGGSSMSITVTNFSISASTLLDAGTSHILINAGNLSGDPTHVFYNVTLAGFGTVSAVSVSQKLTFQGNNSSYDGQSGSSVNEVEFQQKGNIDGGNAYFNTATFLVNGDIDGNNTFLTLNLTPGFLYRFQQGKTTTIAAGGTLNASGTSCSDNITLNSQSADNQSFINTSGANLALQFVTIKDIGVTGGGTISATNSVDQGNNTGWSITPPLSRTLYWVGGGGNWDDVAHWSLSSGGAGGVCIPSTLDDVFFDQNSGFGSGEFVIVNDDIAYCHDMIWANTANMPEFKVSNSLNKLYIYGSLAFDPGMKLNFNGEIHFRSTSPGETVFSAGKTFKKPVYFEGAGEWMLLDDFTSDDRILLYSGTFRTGDHAVSVSNFASAGGALYLGSSNVYVTLTNFNIHASTLLDAGTSHISISNGNLSGDPAHVFYNVTLAGTGTVSAISVSQKLTFQGNNSTYDGEAGSSVNELEFQLRGNIDGGNAFFHIATFLGNGTIDGNNTFENLTFSAGKTYTLQPNRTQTITPLGNFNATGTGAFPIEIKSANLGNQAAIHKDGDPFCLDFVYLTGIAVTGTAYHFAGANSDDVSNNSGWLFVACPPGFCLPLAPVPTLDPASVTNVQPGQQATLILQNLPAGYEALWFDADQTTELYADAANMFQPVLNESTTFYGALRDLTTGCVSELLLVRGCALDIAIVSQTDPSCANNDGAIDINVTGGQTPYSYTWTTTDGNGLSASDEDQTTLSAGTYDVLVTDANGCTNTAAITLNPCPSTAISGNILWEHDGTSGVNLTTVKLSGDQTAITTTNGSGFYSLTVTSGSNFSVTPTKNINKLNGLTVADALAVQRHAANIALLPAPFKRIAADVNKSNSITALDASIINQALLGNPVALNLITSWRFVPTSHVFPNPNAPWGFPEKITFTGVSSSVSGQDFKGVKLGDVVATHANPANFAAGNPLVFNLQDQTLQTGATLTAVFSANQWEDLAAFQLALKFDTEKLELNEIQPLVGLPLTLDNFGMYNISEGEIRAVWSQAKGVFLQESAPVFQLAFKVLQAGGKLSEVLHTDEEVLPGLAYNSVLAESAVVLNFFESTGTGDPAAANGLQLFQNRPNPFAGATAIGFVLPESCEAQLRVFDVAGRVLAEKKAQYAAGRHEEVFNLEGLSGILWYELTTPFGVLEKKMVATE